MCGGGARAAQRIPIAPGIAKFGRGDRDQRLGARIERETAQLGDAVLGDDDVGEVARQRAQPLVAERRDDARDGAAARGRAEADQRAAAGRRERALGERRQPAGAGLELAAGALGVDLAEQVDLDRAVDRDEARDRRDRRDVVGVRRIGEPQRPEAGDEVVERRVAEHDAGRDAGVAVERAGFPQRAQRRRDHAAVQLQPAMPAERAGERRRHRADAELQRVAVAHQLRDMGADARLVGAGRGVVVFEQRRVGVVGDVELRDAWTRKLPRVRGIRGFRWATRRRGARPDQRHEVARQAGAAPAVGVGQAQVGDRDVDRRQRAQVADDAGVVEREQLGAASARPARTAGDKVLKR